MNNSTDNIGKDDTLDKAKKGLINQERKPHLTHEQEEKQKDDNLSRSQKKLVLWFLLGVFVAWIAFVILIIICFARKEKLEEVAFYFISIAIVSGTSCVVLCNYALTQAMFGRSKTNLYKEVATIPKELGIQTISSSS